MKKFVSLLSVAILGGFISLGIDKLFFEDRGTKVIVQEETPIVNTNLTESSGMSVDFINAAEQSINAVVHIKTEQQVQSNYSNDFFEFFGPFGGLNQRQGPQIQQASGSGVIISNDGYIVTNNHVIKNADVISVVLNDKREYTAEVLGVDKATDLALLKINEKELPSIIYGNSDDLKIGEWALAVGNPFNLTSTVTAGIISAKGRNINIISDKFAIESFIQTDAAVNPGNSGGALVNSKGQLVGINTAIASSTGSYAGYSFAIPVNIVKKIVSDLKEYGEVQRAFIGVSIRNIDSKLAEEINVKELNGVYVADLLDDGSAKEAGLKKGDIIKKVNDISVNDVPQLQEQIGKYRPGDFVKVLVERNGDLLEYDILLKNKKGNTEIIKHSDELIINTLGAEFAEVDSKKLKSLNIKSGVEVKRLLNGKLQKSGIRPGFIVTHVDGKEIESEEDILNILKNKTGGVMIEGVYPNGMRAYYAFGI